MIFHHFGGEDINAQVHARENLTSKQCLRCFGARREPEGMVGRELIHYTLDSISTTAMRLLLQMPAQQACSVAIAVDWLY